LKKWLSAILKSKLYRKPAVVLHVLSDPALQAVL